MLKRRLLFLAKAFGELIKDNAIQKGAAIAFFATFSLAPILLIAISIVGFFFGTDLARQDVLSQIGAFIGQDGVDFLSSVMKKSFQPGDSLVAIVFGLLALLFGAAGVFFQIRQSLARIWKPFIVNVNVTEKVVKDFVLPILFVFGVSIVFILMILFHLILTIISNYLAQVVSYDLTFVYIGDYLFSIILMTGVFMVFYRMFSPVKLAWKYAFWGAVAGSLLLQVGSLFIALYIKFAGYSFVYGAAGSLVVFMLWIYFIALIFLYGAEITKLLYIGNMHNK